MKHSSSRKLLHLHALNTIMGTACQLQRNTPTPTQRLQTAVGPNQAYLGSPGHLNCMPQQPKACHIRSSAAPVLPQDACCLSAADSHCIEAAADPAAFGLAAHCSCQDAACA
jgi:hypothetical protein